MNVEQVWLAYQNHLKVFLHKNISNPSDVDDLLQEILIKTYQSLDKVTKTEKLNRGCFKSLTEPLSIFTATKEETRSLCNK